MFGIAFSPSNFCQIRRAGTRTKAQDARQRSPGQPAGQIGGSRPVELIVGIALIVIAALEIWFIVRTVQSNLGRA